MSKAPKQKKLQHHYQPYQNLNGIDEDTDFDATNIGIDPMLSEMSNGMPQSLWDDWTDADVDFGLKLDAFAGSNDIAGVASSFPQLEGIETGNDQNAILNTNLGFPASDSMNMLDNMSFRTNDASTLQHSNTNRLSSDRNDLGMSNIRHKRTFSDDLASMLEDDSGLFGKADSTLMDTSVTDLKSDVNQDSSLIKSTSTPNLVDTNIGWLPSNSSGPDIPPHVPIPLTSTNEQKNTGTKENSSFSDLSFQNASKNTKIQVPMTETNNGASEQVNSTPFGNQGMMMPGFMMYSMPMMGNYSSNVGPMGMMPVGTMGVPIGMPMGMQMSMMGMQMPVGMQMGMPVGMPIGPMGIQIPIPAGNSNVNKSDLKPVVPSFGPGMNAEIRPAASFVNIARKPEEPEVSNILKSLMEEEAKKKEKKLERNRDSARESRKKQQTYVETLEYGIKRLQINKDIVLSHRWGTMSASGSGLDRLSIVIGTTEAFENLQNPASFDTLMKLQRQKSSLCLQKIERKLALQKCFLAIGRLLSLLRESLLQLSLFRNMQSAHSVELMEILQLSEEQKKQLHLHSNEVLRQEVLRLAGLLKVYVVLRRKAFELSGFAPSLEVYMRQICSPEQINKLLLWSENNRSVIESLSFQ